MLLAMLLKVTRTIFFFPVDPEVETVNGITNCNFR